MSDFKAKMHQIRFWLWLRPRPRWWSWSLQRSPRPHSWIRGPFRGRGQGLCLERGGKGGGEGKGEVERRERDDPHLLLNQGPSEHCYATAKFARYRYVAYGCQYGSHKF